MKNIIIILILLGCIRIGFSQKPVDYHNELLNLVKLIEKYHVNPPTPDNQFAEAIFNHFILTIDPDRIYFTQEDLKKLSFYKQSICNELKGVGWGFIDAVLPIINQRLTESNKLITAILSKQMNLMPKDSLTFYTKDTMVFAKEGIMYTTNVEKWLKYQLLKQTILSDNDTVLNCDNIKEASIENTRKRILSAETEKIMRNFRSPGGLKQYLEEIYIKSIAACADPHTDYFTATEKYQFEEQLSANTLSFGINIGISPSNELQIESLVPGSPAWKSNILHKGDILIKIKYENDTIIDFTLLSPEEVADKLDMPNKIKASITVRKTGGMIKTIELTKAKLQQDENIVKSYVLKGNWNIGYISLPGFYTQFENQSFLGCANDVAKECIKLQKENIKGLIIDVRFNGGGSIKEAIDHSGIFIDYGPICMIKQKNTPPEILKDFNKGSIYDGNLVVLVNGQSASASEIFAAAMQDYNRAVIIGAQTFGKATGQMIIPCDSTLNSSHKKTNTGYVKLTIEKLYRLNGTSIQKRGVTPDIILPDAYAVIPYRESMLKYAIEPDQINKKPLFKSFSSQRNESTIKYIADQTEKDSIFHQIIETNKKTKKYFYAGTRCIPLDLKQFCIYSMDFQHWLKEFMKDKQKNTNAFTVELPKFDESLMTLYPENKTIYNELFNDIVNDKYISTAYNFLTNLLNSNNNK